jgi:glycosyltransferase involved in cell wall biosynthesis
MTMGSVAFRETLAAERQDSAASSGTSTARRLDVLALPRYSRAAPSSRYRMLQFLPALARQSIDVEVCPLLGDWYMAGLLANRHPPLAALAGAYWHRVRQLSGRRRPDLIWIERELLPWLPWPLERALLSASTPILLDLDDSQFHRYDHHRSRFVRGMLGDKIDRGMAAARIVTCGSPYIAARAARSGAGRIVDLPTAIDLDRYPAAPIPRGDDGTFVVGWIGTPGNTHYLSAVRESLRRLAAETPLRIVVIGGQTGFLDGLPVEYRAWTEDSEVEALQGIDVGIMPLPDLPWERGKCGLKLLQYMASWKPTVASPVGVNRVLVESGVTGFVADDADDWFEALRRLRSDAQLRRAMGVRGRDRVERSYSLAGTVPLLATLMREAAGDGT